MKTSLAWHNLAHNKSRTATVAAGITFAVVLIFMQLGFFGSIETTATAIYQSLDFDIAIRSRKYLHLCDGDSFSRTRLDQAAAVPGVERVQPFHAALTVWRHPQSGSSRGILAMGIDPNAPAFRAPEIRRQSALLAHPQKALIDRATRAEFGPRDGKQFGDGDIGMTTEVGMREIRLAGHFAIGTGLAADGAVLLGEGGFRRVFPDRPAGDVTLGLVKLAAGADPDEVVAHLNNTLPQDVEALTRQDVLAFERHRWVTATSIGVIFQVGVVVAMLVGLAIVYQVLSSDISAHIAEYATLKAMGYTNGYLAGVVMRQAAAMAVLGFVPGWALSEVLYRLTSQVTNLPIEMNLGRTAVVFALAVSMCIGAGVLALRHAYRADPAELF
ncbi:MAG: ABC transporter permease DevC [Pirellulales bacterium]